MSATLTTPVTPGDVVRWGFRDAAPDHVLTGKWDVIGQTRVEVHLKCSCGRDGWGFGFRVTKNGSAHLLALRAWDDHVAAAAADPTEALYVGSLTTARQTKKYLVVASNFVGLQPYINGSRDRVSSWFARRTQRADYLSLVETAPPTGTSTVKKSVLSYAHNNKRDAIEYVAKVLKTAESGGTKVEWADAQRPDPDPTPTSTSIVVTLSPQDLAERLVQARDSNDVALQLATLNELDELIIAMPLLTRLGKQIRDRVAAKSE